MQEQLALLGSLPKGWSQRQRRSLEQLAAADLERYLELRVLQHRVCRRADQGENKQA